MEHHSVSLLTDISLGIIFATILSHIARILKQPLILGYILGGIVLGKEIGFGLVTNAESIELISEIGLIFLLFIIGLEINLPELAKMGKSMFSIGIAQFVLCVLFCLGFFSLFGYKIGGGNFNLLYIAIGLSLSSTLIVVKLLQDKVEVSTVSGKLTIGVLVLQDIWAILFMGLQPNLLSPEILKILQSIGIIVALLVLSFMTSRYILKHVYKAIAMRPELVLLTSIAWCFFICGVADKAGLSKEMGALIAGMSIAAYPYGGNVISKLSGIRDFFVTLFFVALGMKVQIPTLEIIWMSLVAVGFMIITRLFSIAPIVALNKLGLRNGIITSLNLAQISEFSLVILALGEGYAHITPDLRALILNSMIIASVASTYIILQNDAIARFLIKLLAAVGIKEKKKEEVAKTDDKENLPKRDIALLGYFRIGQAFAQYLEDLSPSIVQRTVIFDFNPAHKEILEAKGFKWEYADLAHPESLGHAGIHDASLVICSISDIFLKGITNAKLLEYLKETAPHAKYIMTVDDDEEGKRLLKAGALRVVLPGVIAGEYLYEETLHILRTV